MEVHLQLYSILREKLPSEVRGRVVLQLDEGTTLAEILEIFDIRRRVVISLNSVHEPDHSRPVQDGDEVKVFSAVSGG